jgi:tubulysin polyketide synthase-like protein
MTAAEAVQAAYSAGVTIRLDGDRLHLEASAPPPAAIVEALKQHKAEIIGLLCAQCGAGLSTGSDTPTVGIPDGNATAWVHPECEPFWREDHWQQSKRKADSK